MVPSPDYYHISGTEEAKSLYPITARADLTHLATDTVNRNNWYIGLMAFLQLSLTDFVYNTRQNKQT